MAGQDFVYNGDLRLLEPNDARLRRDEYGVLTLELGIEERYNPVRLRRCLPLSDPDAYISVRGDDDDEVGIIRDLNAMDPETQSVAREELELYYLKARVTKVLKVERRNGLLCWEIETDRGPRTTYLRSRNDARFMDDGTILLADIHGGRFELPPLSELDERSRFWVETEI